MKGATRTACGFVSACILFSGLLFAGTASATERTDMVLTGDAKCTRCHDETEEYPVLAIGQTRHGTRADSRTPTCTSCHGESDTHVNKPEGATERPPPDIMFGKHAKTPANVRNSSCLGCHQGGDRIHWQSSMHAARDLDCAACHVIHASHDPARDKRQQTEVCFGCHKEQRAQVMRPSRHPIPEGKVACSDCHAPHGSTGPQMMVRGNVNDTCYQCHAEKRGPFLWNHQPVTENCSHCHNPHGTINQALLKVRSPYLCQQCHEPTSHRDLPGTVSMGGGSTSNNTLARGCLNCHTNIHGTNNPFNSHQSQTFRR